LLGSYYVGTFVRADSRTDNSDALTSSDSDAYTSANSDTDNG
jgi:hypothetical protein